MGQPVVSPWTLIRSGRYNEDQSTLNNELGRIFGEGTCKHHGGNESIESYEERTRKALQRQSEEIASKRNKA